MYRNHRERGMTTLGLLVLVAFVGLFIYGGIRLTPLYLEYLSVSKTLSNVAQELDASASEPAIRDSIKKRFEIQDVSSMKASDIEITREGTAWTVRAAYDAEAPFVANIGFVVHFDKTVTLGTQTSP
jgi:hypothetical protein